MLGNLMNILTRSPGLVAQLREFPALAPAAADECARLDAPVQMVSGWHCELQRWAESRFARATASTS
jgi:cytochrome P450